MRRAVAVTAIALLGATLPAQNFKRTDSRSTFVHRIELHDEDGRIIDPAAADAAPYSPSETCKTCHDVTAIAHGWHTNARTATEHGRRGEPWIWSDPRTGTQLPVSWRGWHGTWRPDAVGMDEARFVREFGRHSPGGVGDLEIDCMACHDASRRWRHDAWADAIAAGRLAAAPGAALGLTNAAGTYDGSRFDADGKVLFDVVRTPTADACYRCHTTIEVGERAPPRWHVEEDVHLRAGMTCADCHGSGIDHDTVRGYRDEADRAAFSCAGCHLEDGGFGAPVPQHAGLPPLHLDAMTCTSCHSGPRPDADARAVQSAMAHGLGLPSQTREADDLPGIAAPVFVRGDDGRIGVHRMTWPSFWGWRDGDDVVPMAPDEAFATVRRAFRVRRDLRAEVTDEAAFREGLAQALAAFAKTREDAEPVFVSGGLVHALDDEGAIASAEHPAAEPYSWPLAHDVRPARDSLGAKGCVECHAADAPLVHGTVAAIGPAPLGAPVEFAMHERMELDAELLASWERSFAGRRLFKWVGAVALVTVAALLALGFASGVRRFSERPVTGSGRLRVLALAITGLVVAVLGITAAGALLRGTHLRGGALLVHTIAGGVALPAIAWAAVVLAGRLHGAARVAFWCALTSAVLAGGTIVAATVSLLGTEALRDALVLHRWAGVALLASAVALAGAMLTSRPRT